MEKFYESLAGELSTYVRALAWWYAVPRPPAGALQPALLQRQSRIEMAAQSGGDVDMPELAAGLMPIVHMLFDAGPISGAGQSAATLSWTDLDAWQRTTGTVLPPGQLRLLRRMSAEYLSEMSRASESDPPPPWRRVLGHERRNRVAGHIRNVLRE